MTKCPICNGSIKFETKDILSTYKNHTKAIPQSGYYCEQCGEAFLSPKDLTSNKKDIADFKREVENLLKSDDLARLHLSQQDAAELFGGGIRAFHKYEIGENIQSKPLDIL